ncbi:MAG: hypothetical protein NC420_05495 [Eubacterium sp.]|nr:hypothetical protein [Eubacterium sp.]MCM1215857.1 hypothetical protein [Lachnospiraceae bacterium]MCM1239237.1 hypothetical protein [Lachnospiraceae bacterium]
MEAKYRKAVAPFVVLVMVAVIWHKTGIYFETNDDRCIAEILCGRMTGAPQARTIYVSYLLALPLSWLYRIMPKVPWFGLTLILFQILAYTAVLESIYSHCRKMWQIAAGTVFTGMALLLDLYMLGRIQYTATAGLLAAAGYFCLLAHADTKSGWIRFFVLELLAGMLRSNAMLMMQPMGFLTVGGVLMARQDVPLRKRLALMGKALLPPVAVFLVISAVSAFVYRGSDWKAYMKFLDSQVELFDYEGLPPYDEVRDILEKYQVSETGYRAYADYMMLDWILPPECAEELTAYVREREIPRDIAGVWEELRKQLFEESYWGWNRALAFLWAAVVILALLWRKMSLLFPAAGLLAGKISCWGFLVYQGRLPLRVSLPLLAGEMLLLSALILNCGAEMEPSGNRKRMRDLGTAAFLLGMCVVGFLSGKQQYSYVLSTNNGQKIFMEGLREIRAYCDARPENRYVLDAISMSYYTGSALESEIYEKSNYIVSGNWYSNSPYLRSYNAGYLSGNEGFYYLVYDDGRGLEHPCVSYLIQETGAEPEICDRFTASHGGAYLVYYFDGAYHIEES